MLFPVAVSLLWSWELVRRAQLEIALHHGAFLQARNEVLGRSTRESRRELRTWLRRSLGEERGRKTFAALEIGGVPRESGVRSRLHLRYEQFLRFPLGPVTKHHFEITKSCLFP